MQMSALFLLEDGSFAVEICWQWRPKHVICISLILNKPFNEPLCFVDDHIVMEENKMFIIG